MDRIIIFTEYTTLQVPALMTEAAIDAASGRKDAVISAVCIRNYRCYPRLLWGHAGETFRIKIKSLFDSARRRNFSPPRPLNIRKLSKRYAFDILLPPDQNINHPSFIELIKNKYQPTMAMSFFCLQKFGKELLDIFDYAVINYHNGLLPQYRGLMATAWSVYHKDAETGYTFHRMTPEFDEGNTLISGTVPVNPDSTFSGLEYAKTVKAVNDIPDLLTKMLHREPGLPQSGGGHYYSKKDFIRIRSISSPSDLDHNELIRRLRAFDMLVMRIKRKWYDVTKLKTVTVECESKRKRCFQTADKVLMRPARYWYLPYLLYRILKIFGWPLPSRDMERKYGDG